MYSLNFGEKSPAMAILTGGTYTLSVANQSALSEVLVTVGDLLADSSLSLNAVHLPEGARETPVSWVHATEQPDPRPHLRPSELVCTLGSSLVRSRAARSFVEAVADARAAGICLGLGEVHLEPPRALVDAVEREGIPLLEMPHGVPFLAVNDAVLRRRSQVESAARNQETALLSNLLKLARDGATGEELLTTVSEALGGFVARGVRDALVWEGEGPGPSHEFLAQLASVFEFASREFEREWTERQQQVGQLIDLVADGLAHPAVLLPEAEAHGLDRERILVSSWPAGSEVAIAARWTDVLIGTTARGVAVLSGPELVDSIRDPGLVCGYSGTVGAARLNQAIGESRAALRLARNRGGVVGPDQLVSFEALLEQQPAERLLPFIEQILGPLVRADEEGRGDFVATLRVFIDSNRHLQLTADRLYVHVNTVRNRLDRIQKLSGRDPLSLKGIDDLRVALWAANRQQAVGHRLIRPL